MATPATADLLIHLTPTARDTLQQQLYAGLRRAILTGLLAPGARLPSSRALAADLGVSRITALLAIEQLTAEGYVTARPGSGTYVAPDLPDDSPRVRPIRPIRTARHPPLSARAGALADLRPRAWRLPGPPRPFRMGTPAVDLLPVSLWSQLAGRRLRAASAAQFDYGECPPLREAIAEHLQRARGTHCSADQIVIVAGAQGGLDLMARLLLDPGDAAWMEEPGYAGAQGALMGAGARIVHVPVDRDGLDVQAGIRRAHDARLAYVTPSHQFPLGMVMSLPRRLQLLQWASAAEAWIIEDDYDSEFRYGTRPIPCLHGMDLHSRVIYLGTFSKTLFPSLRLGFLVVPTDLRDRLVAARRALDFQPPLLNQAVLADFLGEGHYERHLRRMRAAYRERLEGLVAAAERFCGDMLRIRPVPAGLHAVADLGDGLDADRVSREAMARGTEAMPLSMYFADTADLAPATHADWRSPLNTHAHDAREDQHAGDSNRTTLRRPAPPVETEHADTENAADAGDAQPQALLLGFGPVRPDDAADGMRRLAAAIEAARSAGRRLPAAARIVRA